MPLNPALQNLYLDTFQELASPSPEPIPQIPDTSSQVMDAVIAGNTNIPTDYLSEMQKDTLPVEKGGLSDIALVNKYGWEQGRDLAVQRAMGNVQFNNLKNTPTDWTDNLKAFGAGAAQGLASTAQLIPAIAGLPLALVPGGKDEQGNDISAYNRLMGWTQEGIDWLDNALTPQSVQNKAIARQIADDAYSRLYAKPQEKADIANGINPTVAQTNRVLNEGTRALKTMDWSTGSKIAGSALGSLIGTGGIAGTLTRTGLRSIAKEGTEQALARLGKEGLKDAVQKAQAKAWMGANVISEGGTNAVQTYLELRNTPTQDLYAKSPEFASLVQRNLDRGMSLKDAEESAKTELVTKAAATVGIASGAFAGIVAPFTEGVGNKLVGRLGMPSSLRGAIDESTPAGSLLSRTLTAGKEGLESSFSEGTEETLQGWQQPLTQNYAKQQYIDRNQDLIEGVGQSMAESLVGGLSSGGIVAGRATPGILASTGRIAAQGAGVVAGAAADSIVSHRENKAIKQYQEELESLTKKPINNPQEAKASFSGLETTANLSNRDVSPTDSTAQETPDMSLPEDLSQTEKPKVKTDLAEGRRKVYEDKLTQAIFTYDDEKTDTNQGMRLNQLSEQLQALSEAKDNESKDAVARSIIETLEPVMNVLSMEDSFDDMKATFSDNKGVLSFINSLQENASTLRNTYQTMQARLDRTYDRALKKTGELTQSEEEELFSRAFKGGDFTHVPKKVLDRINKSKHLTNEQKADLKYMLDFARENGKRLNLLNQASDRITAEAGTVRSQKLFSTKKDTSGFDSIAYYMYKLAMNRSAKSDKKKQELFNLKYSLQNYILSQNNKIAAANASLLASKEEKEYKGIAKTKSGKEYERYDNPSVDYISFNPRKGMPYTDSIVFNPNDRNAVNLHQAIQEENEILTDLYNRLSDMFPELDLGQTKSTPYAYDFNTNEIIRPDGTRERTSLTKSPQKGNQTQSKQQQSTTTTQGKASDTPSTDASPVAVSLDDDNLSLDNDDDLNQKPSKNNKSPKLSLDDDNDSNKETSIQVQTEETQETPVQTAETEDETNTQTDTTVQTSQEDNLQVKPQKQAKKSKSKASGGIQALYADLDLEPRDAKKNASETEKEPYDESALGLQKELKNSKPKASEAKKDNYTQLTLDFQEEAKKALPEDSSSPAPLAETADEGKTPEEDSSNGTMEAVSDKQVIDNPKSMEEYAKIFGMDKAAYPEVFRKAWKLVSKAISPLTKVSVSSGSDYWNALRNFAINTPENMTATANAVITGSIEGKRILGSVTGYVGTMVGKQGKNSRFIDKVNAKLNDLATKGFPDTRRRIQAIMDGKQRWNTWSGSQIETNYSPLLFAEKLPNGTLRYNPKIISTIALATANQFLQSRASKMDIFNETYRASVFGNTPYSFNKEAMEFARGMDINTLVDNIYKDTIKLLGIMEDSYIPPIENEYALKSLIDTYLAVFLDEPSGIENKSMLQDVEWNGRHRYQINLNIPVDHILNRNQTYLQELLFYASDNKLGPSFTPSIKVQSTQLHSSTPLTKIQKKAVENWQEVKNTINGPFASIILNSYESLQEYLFGEPFRNADLYNINDLERLESKRTTVRMGVDAFNSIIDTAEAQGINPDEIEVYYPWGISIVNRGQQAGTGAQANKIMREMLNPHNHLLDITKPEKNALFRRAVCQGFGNKIFKTDEEILTWFQRIRQSDGLKRLMQIKAFSRERNQENMRKFFKNDFSYALTSKDLEIIYDVFTNDFGMSDGDARSVLALKTAYELVQYVQYSEKASQRPFEELLKPFYFPTNIYIEFDGPTDGISNTRVQRMTGEFQPIQLARIAQGGTLVGAQSKVPLSTILETAKNSTNPIDKTASLDLYSELAQVMPSLILRQIKNSESAIPISSPISKNSLHTSFAKFYIAFGSGVDRGASNALTGNIKLLRAATKKNATKVGYNASAGAVANTITDELVNGVYNFMSAYLQRMDSYPEEQKKKAHSAVLNELAQERGFDDFKDFYLSLEELCSRMLQENKEDAEAAYFYAEKNRYAVERLRKAFGVAHQGDQFKLNFEQWNKACKNFSIPLELWQGIHTNCKFFWSSPFMKQIERVLGPEILDGNAVIIGTTNFASQVYAAMVLKDVIALQNIQGASVGLSKAQINGILKKHSKFLPLLKSPDGNYSINRMEYINKLSDRVFDILGTLTHTENGKEVQGDLNRLELATKSLDNFINGKNTNISTFSSLKIPTPPGVSPVPCLTISYGDALVQVYAAIKETVQMLNVYDGVNNDLNNAVANGTKVNEACKEAYFNHNTYRDLHKVMRSVLETVQENESEVANAFVLLPLSMVLKSVDAKERESLTEFIKIEDRTVQISDKKVWDTLYNNFLGQVNMLEAFADQIDARHTAMQEVGTSVDHFAGSNGSTVAHTNPEATLQEGELSFNFEELTDRLNVIYERELAKKQGTERTKTPRAKLEELKTNNSTSISVLIKDLYLDPKSWVNNPKFPLRKVITKTLIDTGVLRDNTLLIGDKAKEIWKQARPGQYLDKDVKGYYDPSTKTIYVFDGTVETAVHELLHAGTYQMLSMYYDPYLRNKLPSHAIAAIQNIIKVYSDVINRPLNTEDDISSIIPNGSVRKQFYESLKARLEMIQAMPTNKGKISEFISYALSDKFLYKYLEFLQATPDYYDDLKNTWNKVPEIKTIIDRMEAADKGWMDILAKVAKGFLDIFVPKSISRDLDRFGITQKGKKTPTHILQNNPLSLIQIVGLNVAIMSSCRYAQTEWYSKLSTRKEQTPKDMQSIKGTNEKLFSREISPNTSFLDSLKDKYNNILKTYKERTDNLSTEAIRERKLLSKKFKMDAVKQSLEYGRRFNASPEDQLTFSRIYTMVSLAQHMDSRNMNALRSIYDQFFKQVQPQYDTWFQNEDQLDPDIARYYSNDKWEYITSTGTMEQRMPIFFATMLTNPYFNKKMQSLKFVRNGTSLKGEDKVNGYLFSLMNKLSNSLEKAVTGNLRSNDLQAGLQATFDLVLERSITNDLRAQALNHSWFHTIDRLDRALGRIVENKTPYLEDSILSKAGTNIANTIRNSSLKFRDITAEFINEIFGSDYAKQPLDATVKRIKQQVDAQRELARDIIPQQLNESFGPEGLDKRTRAILYKALGKTDLSVFSKDNFDRSMKLFGNEAYLDRQIERFEGAIANRNQIRQAKETADYLMNGRVHAFQQTNAYALAMQSKDFNDMEPKLKEAYVDTLDRLISMYMIKSLDQESKNTVRDLYENHKEGMEAVWGYMKSCKDERNKREHSQAARMNAIKGFMPKLAKYGQRIMIGNTYESAQYEAFGFKRLKDYNPSQEYDKTAKSYYYIDFSDLAPFMGQGMQTVKPTYAGCDEVSGLPLESANGGVLTYENSPKTCSLIEKDMRDGTYTPSTEGYIPVYDNSSNIIGFRRTLDPMVEAQAGYSTDLFELIGADYGRIREESMSEPINMKLADMIHDLYKNRDRTRDNEWVPLSSLLKTNKPFADAYRLVPQETKQYMEELFRSDGGIMLRPDMLSTIFGFRIASIGDAWTGISGFTPTTQGRIKAISETLFGSRAYKYAVLGEKYLQSAVSFSKRVTVIASAKVGISNAISDMIHLNTVGVPFNYQVKMLPSIIAECNKYCQLRKRRIELEGQKLMNFRPSDAYDNIQRQKAIDKIDEDIKALSIYPLLEAGEFGSIDDATGLPEAFTFLPTKTGGDLFDKLMKMLPESAVTVSNNILVNNNTALFHALTRLVQYGDFSAKALQFKYMTEVEGRNAQDVLNELRDEYVNYDMYFGRGMQYAQSIGVLWYWTYKTRICRVALKTLRKNPLHSLFAMSMPGSYPIVGDVGMTFSDNLFSKAAFGNLGYTMGLTPMLFNGITMNPWFQLASAIL